MNPINELAALKALAEGVNQRIAEVTPRAAAFRRELGIRGVQDTAWGTVTQRANPPKIAYDQTKILTWARENAFHEVIEEHTETIPASVRPSLMKALDHRLEIVGDVVVDPESGEVMNFASVVPGRESTLVVSMPAEMKELAGQIVGAHVDQLTAAINPEVGA